MTVAFETDKRFTYADLLVLSNLVPKGDRHIMDVFSDYFAMAHTVGMRNKGKKDLCKRCYMVLPRYRVPPGHLTNSFPAGECSNLNVILAIMALPYEDLPMYVSNPPAEFTDAKGLDYEKTGAVIVRWRLEVGK